MKGLITKYQSLKDKKDNKYYGIYKTRILFRFEFKFVLGNHFSNILYFLVTEFRMFTN